MKRYGTPRLRAYAALAATGLLAALLSGRPELVALAAPFGLWLAVGLALSRPPDLGLVATMSSTRVVQGDDLTMTVTLSSPGGLDRLDLRALLPPGMISATAVTQTVRLPAGQPVTVELAATARRWGTFRLGTFETQAYDRLGLVRYDAILGPPQVVKVLPDAGTLDSLIRPANTQIFSGEVVSPSRGDGVEFSDVRVFAAGDRVRDVNWRATARSRELFVNQRLAERNADVVIFLDTFEDLRPDSGAPSSLDVAVSAASSAAAGYLRRRDRVGLVGWGGNLQWLTPAMGQGALHRIVDVLLESRVVHSDAWRGIRILPAGVLPPGALVIALTPVLDTRTVNALFDLRARGSDLAVVELDPTFFQDAGRREQEQLAHRLWRLSRERVRLRFESRGVVVVRWDGRRPFAEAIREVEACRIRLRRRSG